MDKRMMCRELRACKVERDKFNLAIIITILLVSIIVVCCSILVNAEEVSVEQDKTKHYTSIEVEENDTLWNIAKEHNPEHSMTTKEYVAELMHVNNLETDTIYAGETILITYYE